jgi:hypothetical protein
LPPEAELFSNPGEEDGGDDPDDRKGQIEQL